MSTPVLNEALLREVMAFIKIHPERWNQQRWSQRTECGTTYCLAGWTVLLGFDADWSQHHDFDSYQAEDLVYDMARDLLGLTEGQAYELFYFIDGTGPVTPGFELCPSSRQRFQVTFADLVRKVFEVTGIDCKDGIDV